MVEIKFSAEFILTFKPEILTNNILIPRSFYQHLMQTIACHKVNIFTFSDCAYISFVAFVFNRIIIVPLYPLSDLFN